MALTLMDGFEFAPNLRNGATMNGGTASAATGRDGVGKALAGTGTTSYLVVPLPSNQATTVVGVGLKFPAAALGSANTGAAVSLAGDAGVTTHLTLNLTLDGRWQLRRGTSTGTVIATASLFATPADTWGFLEVKATIADAGGICIVKWNGVEHINFTGDTKNAGTLSSVSTLALPVSGNGTVDDLYVLDGTGSAPYNDFIGERVIRVKRPNGNGATNAWVGSDGNSTDNYLLVDDPPPVSSTDYTGSATATDRDLYTLTSATGLASVDAVQNVAYVAKSDAGARSFKTVTRNAGGTVTTSPTVALSTTYALAQGGIELTDPSAAAWTTSNVNTIQAGVEVV